MLGRHLTRIFSRRGLSVIVVFLIAGIIFMLPFGELGDLFLLTPYLNTNHSSADSHIVSKTSVHEVKVSDSRNRYQMMGKVLDRSDVKSINPVGLTGEKESVVSNKNGKNALATLTIQKTWKESKVTIPASKSKGKKLILLYTHLFGFKPWPSAPEDYSFTNFDGSKCPVSSCEVTYDHQKLRESKLVVFHANDLPPSGELRQQRKVNLDQFWAYFNHESPENTRSRLSQLNGLFNLTFTYRLDSDVFVPYCHTRLRKTPMKGKNFAEGKTKMVTFVNSHCDDTRMNFIRALMKFTKVDVYGGCSQFFHQGLPECPRNSKECDAIQKQYKFYLAFENGFCKDYVTEKYWLNSLQAGLVPIVVGGANYSDSRIAIPGSYINALHFPSLSRLATYLEYLDKNDTAYNEYHYWRSKYELWDNNLMCLICKKLNSIPFDRKEVNIDEFWGVDSSCRSKEKEVKHLLQ